MKTSIFSFAVNDKFPIDIQHRQFVKHIDRDFDFILFNDADVAKTEEDINTICAYNKIKCVRVPQEIHKVQNPSEGYAATLNWAVKEYAVKNALEVIVLLHADVFPIEQLSIHKILENNLVASTMEYRVIDDKTINYFYPALTIIDVKNLGTKIDTLDFGLDVGLDTGGKTGKFVEDNPSIIKYLGNQPINEGIIARLDNSRLKEYFTIDLEISRKYQLNAGWIAEGFYHYMAGSQWNAANSMAVQGHKERMELFLKYFY